MQIKYEIHKLQRGLKTRITKTEVVANSLPTYWTSTKRVIKSNYGIRIEHVIIQTSRKNK